MEIVCLVVFLVAFLVVFLLAFLVVCLVVFLVIFLVVFLVYSISTSFSSTISNSISNIFSSSISSSFSSSPPLTRLLCQRVVFRNILSANNLQRLHKEMLSIHVLSFLFFCLFVRPSACLAVFLFFMLLLFQEWYLITKLPYYLRKGDLKLRKTVGIPNCDTNCGHSISSRISSSKTSSFSSSISTSFSSTISNSISNIISSRISSSFSSSPPLTRLLCQRVVFRNILSANNLQRLHKEMLSIHVLSFLFFCLFVRPSACLAVFLFFMLLLFQEWYLITKLPYYLWKGDLKLRKTVETPNCNTNCGNSISSRISSRISSSISTSISSSMSSSFFFL